MIDISVIILSFNEEIHIKRCIERVRVLTNKIFIVDSYSTDKTVEIALQLGATVVQNKWPGNQAAQFNWALDHLDIDTEWIIRLDADEYLTDDLVSEITKKIPFMEENVNGVFLTLDLIFLGKKIKYGLEKVSILRIFRKGTARYAQSWMDERLVLSEGLTTSFTGSFIDDNLNTIGWWTDKHNNYSIREAISILDKRLDLFGNTFDLMLSPTKNKKNFYAKLPMFYRAFGYFVFRYIFKLGFLDGKEGFIRHFLQGWWYRTLVDAKLLEIQKACGDDKIKIKLYLKTWYGLEI
jgi:glycosyltransferase involved in cell wall biosynthesis